MLVLSLGIIAQSLLGITGETHEFVLHAEAGETYTHQHVAHAHANEQIDGDKASQDPLHMLLHQSCVGHGAWVAGMPPFPALPAASGVALCDPGIRRLAGCDLTDLFRPPISA